MPPSPSKLIKARHPLSALDRLLEKAFAPKDTPSVTPLMAPADADAKPGLDAIPDIDADAYANAAAEMTRPMAPEPPPTPLTDALVPFPPVKSKGKASTRARQAKGGSPGKKKAPVRKASDTSASSASFQESADGRTVTATFAVPGVQKDDMHVSFRGKHLVVSWRTVSVAETMEAETHTLVREREIVQNSQIIPLPEGTKFADIYAKRDGRHLVLTYPSSRCVRAGSHVAKTVLSVPTNYQTCVPEQECEDEKQG